MTTTGTNKRIAKNTLILYVRMFFTMLISLYSSRIVLDALGVGDYGVYNVVGGFVSMFSIVSGSLSASISRFITFELGRGDNDKIRSVFSNSINVQIIISLIVVLFAETVGLWFVNEKLVIPEGRLMAANVVYQISILSFVSGLVVAPFSACVIAHENMSVYAVLSIIGVLGRLVIAVIVSLSTLDRLILFAVLLFIVVLINKALNVFYCLKHYSECRYELNLDIPLLKELFSFAGWNFIGSSASILRDQGGNIVINLFCGPAVNAARSVAIHVSSAVGGLVGNFTTAINPQITKKYASNDLSSLRRLVLLACRYSFYLLLFSSLPVIINTDYILDLWLKDVPEHSSLFVQLILVCSLGETLSMALVTAQLATGKIRNYQIVVGCLNAMNLPLSYIALRSGMIPETVVVIAIIFTQVCLIARLLMLRNLIGLSLKEYFFKVYVNIMIVAGVSVLLPLSACYFYSQTFSFLCFSTAICFFSTGITILYIGMSKDERNLILCKIRVSISNYIKQLA